MHKFFIFFIFSRVLSTNSRYGRVAEALQHGLNFSMVDDAVDQWQKRLEACTRAECGHFEHLL